MDIRLHRWIKISFLNLLIVSLLGVLMRYKIACSFPFLQQKFILHAHSHFAFSGWITQILMVLMVKQLQQHRENSFALFKPVLVANLITAYGMLLSFPLQGYGAVSITFSTLNIFTAYWFGVKYWKAINARPCISNNWFKAAIVFNILSSAGAFFLAFMMATKNLHPDLYLAAVYLFLHFQYNGWFFFACMGLFSAQLVQQGIRLYFMRGVFVLFAAACVPAYFLSALWLPIPVWIYVLVVISAVAQVVAAAILFYKLWQQRQLLLSGNAFAKWLVLLSAFALIIKLLLQMGSTIPSLSNLAFGFRPIVIGYLHLVLLGVITLFIIGYVVYKGYVKCSALLKTGIVIFTAGILLNELLLMLQGITAMSYHPVSGMDIFLLIAAVVMFSGLFITNIVLKPADE